MFEPIQKPESAVDACTHSIRNAILSGDLAPGDRLPPERRLADRFGVNRVTLRTALSRLAASNLLTVRQGSGYIVQDYRARGGPDLLPGLARLATDASDFRDIVVDLLRVRRALATGVLQRLADGVSETSLARIDRAIDRFEADARAGATDDVLAQRDMEVVGAIIDATGSAVFRLCMNPIATVVASFPELRRAIYAAPLGNVAGFRLLVASLRAGRVDAIDVMINELERRDQHTLKQLTTDPTGTEA